MAKNSEKILVWPTIKRAWGVMATHVGRLIVLSLVFMILFNIFYSLWLFELSPLDPIEGKRNFVSVFLNFVMFRAVVLALPATVLITSFLRAVARTSIEPSKLLSSYIAVYWRTFLLCLLFGIGDVIAMAPSYFEASRPEGPLYWGEFIIVFVLQVVLVLLALRLSPTLANAAIGQSASLTEVWRSMSGQFSRFLLVFLGIAIPLFLIVLPLFGALSALIMPGEAPPMALFPFVGAVSYLIPTIAIAAVLAVTSLVTAKKRKIPED